MSVPSEQREAGTSVSPEEIDAGKKAFRERSHRFVETTGLDQIFEQNHNIEELAHGFALQRAETLAAAYELNGDIVKFDKALRGEPKAMDALKQSPSLVEQVQRLIRGSGLTDEGRQAAVPSEPRLEPANPDDVSHIGGSHLTDGGRQAAVLSEPQLEPPNSVKVPRSRRGSKSSSIDR